MSTSTTSPLSLTTSRTTRLTDLISPGFYGAHWAVREHTHTHFWLRGGRGSTKSSFAALEIVLGMKRDPNVNALVVRKVADTLRDSVFAQMLWAIDILGVGHEFHASFSPMEITYLPTGQRILFRGVDDPSKLKSLKVRAGYIGLVWFEELDRFWGMGEIRNVLQSVLRGGETFTVFYSYNPPKSRDSWVNREAIVPHADRLVHESSYTDVPPAWLGPVFLAEAEELRTSNPTAYAHEYLGDVTGTGGAVFENLSVQEIPQAQVDEFDRISNGVDWGYFPDPWVLERCHYDSARRTLYVFDEATATRTGNDETGAMVLAKCGRQTVLCDSAEPKSIHDYCNLGILASPVKKGAGSVEYGMKWLQALKSIVIDPKRCPLAAEEFTRYEYERNREGEYCTGFPDMNNHAIDAVRYAQTRNMRGTWSTADILAWGGIKEEEA